MDYQKVPGRNVLKKLGTVIALLMLGAGSANASPVDSGTYVDFYLKQNTFPSGLVEEMIFLDKDTSSTIIGHVGGQFDPRLVNFTSTTDQLVAANGFANIKALDGKINNVTITAPGYWFEDLIFSVNPFGPPNPTTDLTVTAIEAPDGPGGPDSYNGWTTEGDWVPGENRLLVLAMSGNLMQSVTIDSTFGIFELKQFEISGLSPVPVPAAVWLFGTALIGFIGVSRRRNVA